MTNDAKPPAARKPQNASDDHNGWRHDLPGQRPLHRVEQLPPLRIAVTRRVAANKVSDDYDGGRHDVSQASDDCKEGLPSAHSGNPLQRGHKYFGGLR